MQSPTMARFKAVFPEARVTVWVAVRGTKVLAEINPNIDEIIESPIKLLPHEHLKLVWRLNKQHFDTGLVLSPGQLWKSAAYLYLAGIPRRIGNAYPFRRNPESSFLLTDAVPENENLHDIEQNLRLLDPLGIDPYKLQVTSYKLDIPEGYREKAVQLLRSRNIPADRTLIGFHMGSASNFTWKRWPLENFIGLGQSLVEKHDAHILLFGDPSEEELKETVKQALGEQATSISADLLTTAAVISYCQLFVSNDSGLMHLAAAIGTPTFGLFGPTNEAQTGPRGKDSHVIRAPDTQPVYHTERNSSLGNHSHQSMRVITPALVLTKMQL